jgi:DNA polymerase I
VEVSEVTADCRSGSGEGPLFLLDGNNIAYRAFFALPSDIATSDGLPTNALYGFCLMVIKILADYRPGAVIVAWDSREKTFRHEEFEDYKAQRKPMPDLLSQQWPYFTELCAAFGFVNLAVPGFEADDILATLARQAEAEGRETVIVTGDRDALQLAGRHVSIMANTRGVTEVKIYDPAAVEERFGVPPRLIPDLIGLKGDTSDNIPGVPGIGDKTAAQLLAQFGSLGAVLERVDEVAGAKKQELLREHRDLALLSRKLALLDRDAPIDIQTAGMQPHSLHKERLEELFARLEFTTLFERVAALSPAAVAPAPRAAGARLPLPQVWASDADPLGGPGGTSIDPSRPLGIAVEPVAPGPAGPEAHVWLAQIPPRGDPSEYGRYTLVTVGGEAWTAAALGPLLAGAGAVCHDLKAQRGLRGVVTQAAHDTYIGAYLLAPGRRDYRLDDLAAEAGIPAPECALGGLGTEVADSVAATATVAEATSSLLSAVSPVPAPGPAAAAAALVLPVAAHQEAMPPGAGDVGALPGDRTAADPGARRHGGGGHPPGLLPPGGDDRQGPGSTGRAGVRHL